MGERGESRLVRAPVPRSLARVIRKSILTKIVGADGNNELIEGHGGVYSDRPTKEVFDVFVFEGLWGSISD